MVNFRHTHYIAQLFSIICHLIFAGGDIREGAYVYMLALCVNLWHQSVFWSEDPTNQ